MINHDELTKILNYDPDTGLFTWARTGKIAGGISEKGYIRIQINRRKYMAHRLAWLFIYQEWPKEQIDHINHVRNDNRLCNLTEATNQENAKNRGIQTNNSSGSTGVLWSEKHKNWKAQIKVDQKVIYLGTFINKNEAIKARNQAEKDHGFHENHGKT